MPKFGVRKYSKSEVKPVLDFFFSAAFHGDLGTTPNILCIRAINQLAGKNVELRTEQDGLV